MRVLVVEDDVDVADNICQYLELRGHVVDMACDGQMGLRLSEQAQFDAIVLDLTLPRLDGLEVCRRLRIRGASPAVLMLTARDTVESKLEGFEAGADDYLVKPFALAELEMRLRVLSERLLRWGARELRIGNLSLNIDTREVCYADRAVTTTRAGRRVLELLMRNAHRVVTRAEIEQMLWPDEPPVSDVLRTHIHGLRRGLAAVCDQALIRTVKGEGYRIESPP